MKRMHSILVVVTILTSLAIIGCSQEADNPTSPVLNSPEELSAGELNSAINSEGEGFEITGEGFYASGLSAAEERSVGEFTLRFYTRRPLDTSVLLEDLDEDDDSTTIQSKINAKREQLYPDEEIALEIDGGSETGNMVRLRSSREREMVPKAATRARLVKRFILWNRVHGRNGYFWARYRSTVATYFVNVMQGTYKLYTVRGSSWKYIGATRSIATGYSVGSSTLRGYQVLGVNRYNKIDIVMYFFR